MIARAIGKPVAKAPTIIKVNAESKFTSGRRLSTDMLLAPPRGSQNAVAGTSLLEHCVQKVQSDGAQRWLTEY